jgi:hypothetical protein
MATGLSLFNPLKQAFQASASIWYRDAFCQVREPPCCQNVSRLTPDLWRFGIMSKFIPIVTGLLLLAALTGCHVYTPAYSVGFSYTVPHQHAHRYRHHRHRHYHDDHRRHHRHRHGYYP